jgi:hypothetical protein
MKNSVLPHLLCHLLAVHQVSGYAFVARRHTTQVLDSVSTHGKLASSATVRSAGRRTAMKMVDQSVIEGAGIAIAGLAVGIGMVAFTEAQGERAKERGGGLSDSMTTRIAGGLMEDVEVSTVSDLGSLTMQLEKALKESGGASEEELVMTEDDKQRLVKEADDGW